MTEEPETPGQIAVRNIFRRLPIDVILMTILSGASKSLLLLISTGDIRGVVAYMTSQQAVSGIVLVAIISGVVSFLSCWTAEWKLRTKRNQQATWIGVLAVYVFVGMALSVLLHSNGYARSSDGLLVTLSLALVCGPAMLPLAYRYIGLHRP